MSVDAQKDEGTLKLVTLSIKPKQDTSVPQLTNDTVPSPTTEKPSLFDQADDDDEEAVEEPKVKVSKKKKDAPAPDVDLASLLDEFDD
jgi:hypothetical protein